MNKFLVYIACYLLGTFGLLSQESLDSLSFEAYLELVKEHHPLARKALLQTEIGKMEVRSKRGAFDPRAYADVSQKYFNELQYYSRQEGGIVVPTWLGIEVEGGFQNNNGEFLNPEANVPEEGQWWAGLSVPIGRDLFIDSRRAALRQAKIFREATHAQQTLMLNELLLKAGKTYWKWFSTYHKFKVIEESVKVVEIRFRNTLTSAESGEQASIDTVEAKIQLQNRKARLQKAKMEYQNARIELSTFLWYEGSTPLLIKDEVIPPAIEDIEPFASRDIYTDSILNNHPLIRSNELNIEQLEIERKLKAEQLKPKLDLKYRALQRTFDYSRDGSGFIEDNYSWGLNFSFPLFIRTQRGELQKIKLNLQQNKLELNNRRQEIRFEILAAINQWEASAQQVELYENASTDYFRLLNAEQQLFQIGESSVFMVNNRELGYIQAQLNWIDAIGLNQQARLETYFALGKLLDL